MEGVEDAVLVEPVATLFAASPKRLAQSEPVDIAQRIRHGESPQLVSVGIAHDDEVFDREPFCDSLNRLALCLEVDDLARLRELSLVMGGLGNRPQHLRIAVEFEEPEEFPDDDQVAVWK